MPEVLPVLAEVSRNGFVESRHRGALVLLAADGSVDLAVGDPDATVLPRSSLKPFQATAMTEHGYPGRDELLALAAASHIGEDVHIAGVRRILAAAGLDESALQCPPALPAQPGPLLAWTRNRSGAVGVDEAGAGEARICHNCSGKHAAMLATCMASGWDIANYRDPAHPLQRAARAAVEHLTGDAVRHVAVDGCGAPAFGVSLLGLARGFARLMTSADGSAAALVRDAMRAHPRMIAGTGEPDTALMAAVPGLLCKGGAEGVTAAALPDGRAVAAKFEDGAMRARPPLLVAVLRRWGVHDIIGVDTSAVAAWAETPVLGGGEPQGAVAASAELLALLAP